jgi:FixJ family two-component response regulator
LTDRNFSFVVAVVDDDHGILRSLQYLLESADYDVRLFSSAAALLDSDCLPRIDCLISDIDMPRMDGLELVRLLRAELVELPVILITGYPERLTRLQFLAGANLRCFKKPFNGPELLAAVNGLLRGL